MKEKINIENTPIASELWKGIGGHFDTFSQILCEFIDNSISNFIGNNLKSKTIIIDIKQLESSVLISIEDSGTGIKNLSNAFCLGNKESIDSPLNEHGFGMKHALASANPENSNWCIYTRTKEEFNQGFFKKIKAPYNISNFYASLISIDNDNYSWPGELNGSGTFVKFECSWDLFYTIRRGISGRKSSFSRLIDILAEDLGFIYSGLIAENKATITIQSEDEEGNLHNKDVVSITPNWDQTYNPGHDKENIDLGGGKVTLLYEFGAMKTADTYRYYKKNMSSSGVEIRINGRIMEYNLFKSVWGIERHNMYNHLLIRLNLVSANQGSLPKTRTSKNGLREGDQKFSKLLEWVRHKMPDPRKDIEGAYNEADLFEELAQQKKIHLPAPKTITRNQKAYRNINEKVGIDLYLHYLNNTIIYKGKRDKTSINEVYRLKMYWDGCVLDGIQPSKGILISAHHPKPVLELVELINDLKDFNGENYQFETKTWKDEGIRYPN